MKTKIKRRIKGLAIVLVLIIIFRGSLFRASVKYTSVGERSLVKITNKDLLAEIESNAKNKELNIELILETARDVTNANLHFSTGPVSSNPNNLMNTRKANCVGYSAIFNSIVHHLLQQSNLHPTYEAKHCIGKIKLFGLDLHQFTDSPFFRDHDFNVLINKVTGETIAVDPSLDDYLYIDRVSFIAN